MLWIAVLWLLQDDRPYSAAWHLANQLKPARGMVSGVRIDKKVVAYDEVIKIVRGKTAVYLLLASFVPSKSIDFYADWHRQGLAERNTLCMTQCRLVVKAWWDAAMSAKKNTKQSPLETLRVECFMLCDYVREENDKLYIIGGGWNRIRPVQLPAKVEFSLAGKLVARYTKQFKPFEVSLHTQDETGEDITDPARFTINPDSAYDAPEGSEIPLYLPLSASIETTRPGKFSIVLSIDGRTMAETTLIIDDPTAGLKKLGDDQEEGAPLDFSPPDEETVRTGVPAEARGTIGDIVIFNGRPYEIVAFEPRNTLVLQWMPRERYVRRLAEQL